MSKSKTGVFNSINPIASYDESECYDAAINHLIESGESPTEVEASEHTEFNWLFQDYCAMYWFDMEETVRQACAKYLKNGAGLVCPAFGWRKAPGANNFERDAFTAFKQAYLDTGFSIRVYLKKDSLHGVHLDAVVYHHDSPMGDHMLIVSKKYHEQWVQKYFGQKAT